MTMTYSDIQTETRPCLGTETLKDHHPYRHQDCSSALWPHTGHILGCGKDHLHENETS